MGIPATVLTVGEMNNEGIERVNIEMERKERGRVEKIYIPSLNSSTMIWIKSLSADSRTLFMNMGAVQRGSASTRWGRQTWPSWTAGHLCFCMPLSEQALVCVL